MRQDERSAATIRRILAEAEVAFANSGFGSASLDAIVAAAGYSKGAFYAHFRTKQALFLAVVGATLAGADERLAPVAAALAAGANPQAAARCYLRPGDLLHARLIGETWHVAVHDDAVRALLEAFRQKRAARLALACVSLGPTEARERAALTTRLIDAHTIEAQLEQTA